MNWGFGMGALPGGDIRQSLRVQMLSSGSSDPDIGSNSLGGGPSNCLSECAHGVPL